jgi:hypothetical protein
MIILGPAAVDGGGRLDPQTAIFGLLADAVDDDVGDIEGDGAGASIAQISIAKPGISIAASVKCRTSLQFDGEIESQSFCCCDG